VARVVRLAAYGVVLASRLVFSPLRMWKEEVGEEA
jgi:hypothetical protein